MPERDKLKRYAAILRPPRRYPVWSVRSVVTMLLVTAGISAIIAGLVPNLEIIARVELTLAICALSIFWMMAYGLYRGARVKRKDLPTTDFQSPFSADDAAQVAADVPPDAAIELGAEGGCLGVILSIALWLAITVLAGIVLWAVVQFGGALIVGFIFALSWITYRALRQVFARSRQTQGKLAPSLGYAAFYTLLYTGWLFVVLHIAAYLRG